MLVSYTILRLDPVAPFSTTLRVAAAARQFLRGGESEAQLASLLEDGHFQISETETLDFSEISAGPIDDTAPEVLQALQGLPGLDAHTLIVNRSSGLIYRPDPRRSLTEIRLSGDLISLLASPCLYLRAANDQPQRSLDEGTRNIASYIIGSAVPALESQAQDFVRLGRPVEVCASEMVSMLLMSVTLAWHQRHDVESGHIKPDQTITPRDILSCIKIARLKAAI